ncbi:LysR family transcriptional regulator [Paenibacillaceae bacterium]|nr:LysR family transcriptional regulator [Paenibacillaceae bacterium]
MEIRLLKTFQTIARLGNFQRAAEALQYSPPTITVQIKKLEEELGVTLFERGKTITLTSAGRFFLTKADVLLHEYDELNNELNDYIAGETGIVRIGASEPSASNRLPNILNSFKKSKPKVQIQVTISTSLELTKLLLEDQLDFALSNFPAPHLELSFHPLLLEPFGLLIPDDHPFADRDRLFIRDLQDESFLVTPGTCPFRLRVEEMMALQFGKPRNSSIEVAGITALKYYVQAKLGIALAPLVAISPPIPGTLIKPVVDMFEGPELGILTKRNKHALSKISILLIEEIKRSI